MQIGWRDTPPLSSTAATNTTAGNATDDVQLGNGTIPVEGHQVSGTGSGPIGGGGTLVGNMPGGGEGVPGLAGTAGLVETE